jgi:outer membrane protein OmpA-like peptidoglycan-associated protein
MSNFSLAIGLVIAALAGGSAAEADCPALMSSFDQAVAAKSVEGEWTALAGINKNFACNKHTDEFRRKLIDSMIDLAGDPKVSPEDHEMALKHAGDALGIGGTWRQAKRLADFYADHKDNKAAFSWYEAALGKSSPLPADAMAPADATQLRTRAAAAKLLASDDEGGAKKVALAESHRDMNGALGGIYTRAVEVESVPLPINFNTDEATLTPVGQKAAEELGEAVAEQHVRTVTLVGHTDIRGDHNYNVGLSLRRAEAVRAFLQDYLKSKNASAKILVDGKGPDEPFDRNVLGHPIGDEDGWALDRRVEWVRDPATE